MFNKNAFLKYFLILIIFNACSADKNKESTTPSVTKDKKEEAVTQHDENLAKDAFFGDLHIHTSWSFDAFVFNVKIDPNDAYRFGKGEAIDHIGGKKIKINRPLDFMAVTEHAEYMGLYLQLTDENGGLTNSALAKDLRSSDREKSTEGFVRLGASMGSGEQIPELENEAYRKSIWNRVVSIADKHYHPGSFTTFPAYEWTVSYQYPDEKTTARNLHRNIIFRSSKVPNIPFSNFDSKNPEDLWHWMDEQREKGIEVMAIPHNANKSDGLMYPSTNWAGEPIDAEYAQLRMRNEPISEVSQIKGTSMTHPALSPDDDFAGFEITNLTFGTAPVQSEPQGSYVRQALKDGLVYQKNLGANPYKFGFIGSTDSHNGSSPAEEYNYSGKIGIVDHTDKVRRSGEDNPARWDRWSAGSLAGVWAIENTREALFDAMLRKETFATSGPRMKVRLYSAWDFPDDILEQEDWAITASKVGVPMGSDLPPVSDSNKVPSFLVWAIKDAESGNLDRIQIVKGWVDENGESQENVFNVVWAGDRKMNKNGKLGAIGNTVNVADASYENSIGSVSLKTIWSDPEFDVQEDAFYYARVLEIPTPRWSTYDAKAMGVSVPTDVPATIQERAWSSPIWYTPQ